MASACQILRWALALGLGLTFKVTHAFRSQGRKYSMVSIQAKLRKPVGLEKERSQWARVGGIHGWDCIG
jgi:hypothetical protein